MQSIIDYLANDVLGIIMKKHHTSFHKPEATKHNDEIKSLVNSNSNFYSLFVYLFITTYIYIFLALKSVTLST